MTVKELYEYFDKKIDRALSCDWDNDGLMCCPRPNREVRRVLVSLDVTDQIVLEAIEGGYDLVISHHPLIFRGVKSLVNDGVSAKLVSLIEHGISVFSFHTRLDAADGGVNDILAELLGLEKVEKFGSEGVLLGRVGELPESISPEELALKVKALLGCEGVLLSSAGLEAHRVALVGGEGSDEIDVAIAVGADTFISGRLGYHNMVDAPERKINLIEAGHFFTEYPVTKRLAALVREADANVEVNIVSSNRIKLI